MIKPPFLFLVCLVLITSKSVDSGMCHSCCSQAPRSYSPILREEAEPKNSSLPEPQPAQPQNVTLAVAQDITDASRQPPTFESSTLFTSGLVSGGADSRRLSDPSASALLGNSLVGPTGSSTCFLMIEDSRASQQEMYNSGDRLQSLEPKTAVQPPNDNNSNRDSLESCPTLSPRTPISLHNFHTLEQQESED